MLRFACLPMVTALAAGAAAAQGQPAVTEVVTLTQFYPATNLYDAQISIKAIPCTNSKVDLTLYVDRVRDADEARARVKEQVAEITEDVRAVAAKCRG